MRTVDLAGCPVGCASRGEWVGHLLGCIERGREQGRVFHHVSMNAAKWVAMRRDRELREAVLGATSWGADGSAVVLASRWLGDPLPEKVAGCDLAQDLLARGGLKVALFGATPEVLSEVVRRWEGRGVRVVYARDGYVREEEHPSVAREVAGSGADLLLVAMGTPKSERFIARHMEEMGVPLCMGVGGCFDVMAGVVRRAPEVVSRWHLEWAWRLSGSPRARFQRAVVDSARFVSAIARGERLTASSRR